MGDVEYLVQFFYDYAKELCYATGIVLVFVGIMMGKVGIPKPVKKCQKCGERHDKNICC